MLEDVTIEDIYSMLVDQDIWEANVTLCISKIYNLWKKGTIYQVDCILNNNIFVAK